MNSTSGKSEPAQERTGKVYYHMSHDLKNLPLNLINKNVKVRYLKKEEIPEYLNLVKKRPDESIQKQHHGTKPLQKTRLQNIQLHCRTLFKTFNLF